MAGCRGTALGSETGAPHAGVTLRTRPAVRPGARSVPRTARKRQGCMLAPGAACGETGDSLDRVCEDPPPVSDPGPGVTHGGGRQGRAGPAQPNKGGLQSRPDRGLRAHPGTPEQAWLPDTPEMLTPEELGELLVRPQLPMGGTGPPLPRALHWEALSSSKTGVLRPQPLDWQLLLPILEERGLELPPHAGPASRSLPVRAAGQTVTPHPTPHRRGASGHHHL